MNLLHQFIEFETYSEGQKRYQEAIDLRDQVVGKLYYSILTEDIREIGRKVNELFIKERREKNEKARQNLGTV